MPSFKNLVFSSILRGCQAAYRKFIGDDNGNIAIIFAAAVIPTILTVGAAIDYSRVSQMKTAMQTALDSTALHLGLLPHSTSQADLETAAEQFFALNYQGNADVTMASILVSKNGPIINLSLDGYMPTMFMGIANIDQMDIGVVSEVMLGGGTIEIALVLDNSGSMAGSKIAALKSAAQGLVETLYDSLPPNSTDLSFSLVPFATFVDIGENNANEPWMDINAQSSIHQENFNQNSTNRFDLYDNITNVQWEGCVEARPYPYDVDDTVPHTSNPDSLFVPSFAPDEPGNAGDTRDFYNSYLDDSNDGNLLNRQRHVRKYDASVTATPAKWGTTYNFGPSFLCKQSDLLPLTTSQNTIETNLQNMFALGGTNIAQGLVWGWRTLSPAVPFTAGRAYSDNRNQKILILLTDGKNTYNGLGLSHMNKSLYSAYGFAAAGRLGTTSGSSSVLGGAMNVRTAEACANIKDSDILVYTITFDLDDAATLSLMERCATTPSQYFDSPGVSQLDEVFEEIASKLLKLRLTK